MTRTCLAKGHQYIYVEGPLKVHVPEGERDHVYTFDSSEWLMVCPRCGLVMMANMKEKRTGELGKWHERQKLKVPG